MDYFSIGIGIFLILLGVLIKHGKMYWLVAGYNTSSTKEKEKFDIEGYAVVMRNGLAIIGISVIIVPILVMTFQLSPNFRLIELPIILGVSIYIIRSSKNYYNLKR